MDLHPSMLRWDLHAVAIALSLSLTKTESAGSVAREPSAMRVYCGGPDRNVVPNTPVA